MNKSSKQGGGTTNSKSQIDDYIYDEIFEDTNDLFFLDNDERSLSNGGESKDSSGDYLTE